MDKNHTEMRQTVAQLFLTNFGLSSLILRLICFVLLNDCIIGRSDRIKDENGLILMEIQEESQNFLNIHNTFVIK